MLTFATKDTGQERKEKATKNWNIVGVAMKGIKILKIMPHKTSWPAELLIRINMIHTIFDTLEWSM